MPTLVFETTLSAPVEKVWELHEDVAFGLPALSPPEAEVRIERADLPVQAGSLITVSANGPLGRVNWVAKIVEHHPPHGVVFGREARFVDEQQSGPFKFWRHEHEFEALDSRRTRMVDRVTYRVGWGVIGWAADAIFVRRQITAMFRHRHATAHRLLDEQGSNSASASGSNRPARETKPAP